MPRPIAPSPRGPMAWLTSIALCATAWSGTACARTRLVVLPPDRAIQFLPKGASYQADQDIYLVPPATLHDLIRALNRTNPPAQ